MRRVGLDPKPKETKNIRCSPSERNHSTHKTEPVELRSNRIEPRRSRNSRFETLRHFLQVDKRTRFPFEACENLALKNARKPRYVNLHRNRRRVANRPR